jgi:hypothetical protein
LNAAPIFSLLGSPDCYRKLVFLTLFKGLLKHDFLKNYRQYFQKA